MIKLYFEKLSCFDRIKEPCSVAIPFSKGELDSESCLTITDGKNISASQSICTSRWNDNSVKWALVNFSADLPSNKDKTYYCNIEKQKNDNNHKIKIHKNKNITSIDTGELLVQLNNTGKIFNYIKKCDFEIKQENIKGPLINNKYEAIVQEEWKIVQNGEVTAILENRGKHFDKDKNSLIDFIITIQFFAFKDWFKIDYKIINKENSESEDINSIKLDFNLESNKDVNLTIAKSNYKTDYILGNDNDDIYYCIDAQHLIYEANEHIPEVFYGTFFADWRSDKGGLCATLYQAYQNYPKALKLKKNSMSIQIIPDSSEGIVFYRGMAKTHTLFLHVHSNDENIESINARSLQFQMPDRPVIESEIYKKAEVFPDIFIDDSDKINKVETALIYRMDSRGKAYGILNWGDSPDLNYTSQGRGDGELVWTNNEYDFVHTAMLFYARTCQRRILDYLLVTAKHWIDVDICHYSDDEFRQDGQVIHSARHISGDVEISHEWVEGLFDYYHMTGDKYAYDMAINIGKNIKRNLSKPKYHKNGEINARETGWALRALVSLYNETNDKSWLEDADFIIEHFKNWKEKYGLWLAPYTDNTAIRVPFMISIAIGSLMRYYRINPCLEIKEMIIDAAEDLFNNCILDNGLFYYKELPSLKRLGNNTTLLEAMTYAYELTGDIKYIKAGIPTFLNYIEESKGSYTYKKQNIKDAVILSGPSVKVIAQSFFPVVNYYVTSIKAKMDLFKEEY